MHFVPPHSPYTPRPQFRKWNDPGYRGECDGTEEYLDAIHKQRFEIDDEDIRELVALYDGNLLMADAAVQRIVRAIVRHGDVADTVDDIAHIGDVHLVFRVNSCCASRIIRIKLLIMSF